MAPRIWDPYRVLNITSRHRGWMHCMGHVASHDGARCRWKIDRDSFAEVISILEKMEVKPPNEIPSKMLTRLAGLSLCQDYHQGQRNRILDEWDEEIGVAAKSYEKLEKWKARCKEFSDLNEELRAQLEASSKQDSEDEVSERVEQKYYLERESFNTYRKDAEAAQIRQAALETDLRSKLAEADKMLAKQRTDLKDLRRREADLVKETEDLIWKLYLKRTALESSVKDTEKLKKDLSAEVRSLKAQLSTERQAIETLEDILDEAKSSKESALKDVADLQSQAADERAKYYGLYAELKAARAQDISLREHLSKERWELDQAKRSLDEIEKKKAELHQEAESLRSQVEREQQKSEQLSDTLSREAKDLQSQLAAEREKADRLAEELSKLKEEKASLAAQFSRECQASSQLRARLDQVKAERISLADQTEDLRTKLQTERQNCENVRLELDASKAQGAAVAKRLEEQEVLAGAMDAASSAERARLLDQIDKLERHSISKLFGTFWDKLKIMVAGAVSRLACGRRRRQAVAEVGVEMHAV